MKDLLRWLVYGSVFAVPFVLLLVSSSMFFPYITGKNFAFRILVEIAFASWLLLALVDKAWRPRVSYILYAVLGLVGVMLVANIFGEYAHKSFWSNYERMEGWVTLLHFAMYFVVLGSVIRTEKLWNYFFNTALVAAAIMSCFALAQVAGVSDISQGGSWRVDGRLGNSTYLGVYMIFHIFIAAWMMIRSQATGLRVTYGALIVVFAYILSQTGTRGAMYGLIGGSILSFLYLALMAPKGATIKKWALGGLLAVVLVASGVWLVRDSEFVQNSPALNRFAGTTWAEGNIRFTVWGMASEGVKEHPILGWGQENFSYVFNKYYDPALYGAEPWYDRTHNIFLDWLIAGGVLGLIAYLSILASALWYAHVLPLYRRFTKGKREEVFTVYEQALLLGLLAAYMFHNLFVFDNLGSWIFYAVVLALVHSRVSNEWSAVSDLKMSGDTWQKVAVPLVGVVTLATLYLVNVPSMQAAGDIIDGYRASSATGVVEAFRRAYDRGGFGDQEIFEQFSQAGAAAIGRADIKEGEKEKVIDLFEEFRGEMVEKKPGDTRLHVISAGFYQSIGDLNKAMAELNQAEELSTDKQAIKEDQGRLYLMAGQPVEALERYRVAYELDERNERARVHLAAAHLFKDDLSGFTSLIPMGELDSQPGLRYAVANNQILAHVAYQKKQYDILEFMLKERIKTSPGDKGLRTNLAALYFEQGEYREAEAIIRDAIADIPGFKEEGEALLKEIQAKL